MSKKPHLKKAGWRKGKEWEAEWEDGEKHEPYIDITDADTAGHDGDADVFLRMTAMEVVGLEFSIKCLVVGRKIACSLMDMR